MRQINQSPRRSSNVFDLLEKSTRLAFESVLIFASVYTYLRHALLVPFELSC